MISVSSSTTIRSGFRVIVPRAPSRQARTYRARQLARHAREGWKKKRNEKKKTIRETERGKRGGGGYARLCIPSINLVPEELYPRISPSTGLRDTYVIYGEREFLLVRDTRERWRRSALADIQSDAVG